MIGHSIDLVLECRTVSVVGFRIKQFQRSDLLEVRGAVDSARFIPRGIQRRQQHPGKDCNHGNRYKELYEGKSAGFPLEI